MALTDTEIDAILKKKESKQSEKTPRQHSEYRSQQKGPLRWYERPMPCLHHSGNRGSGCGSPTYCKVEHQPLCLMHALLRLNELIMEAEKNAAARLFQRQPESPTIYEEAIRRQEGH